MKSVYLRRTVQASVLAMLVIATLFLNLPGDVSLEKVKGGQSLVSLEDPITDIVRWAQRVFGSVFEIISTVIGQINRLFDSMLRVLPIYGIRVSCDKSVYIPILGVALTLLIWFVSGYKYGLGTFVTFEMFANLGYWDAALSTLSLVLTATLISIAIGFPLGVVMARSDTVEALMNPVLDFMQSFPPYVYLVPAVVFFGLGAAPGIIATVIFAVPPPARLTNLGIREVPPELIEAGQSFGCSTLQLLYKVELPTAFSSLLLGLNQCIMMSLGMVIIAALIGAGGLGAQVIIGIQRLWIGKGIVSGFLVVVMAVWIDRVTQSFKKGGGERDIR